MGRGRRSGIERREWSEDWSRVMCESRRRELIEGRERERRREWEEFVTECHEVGNSLRLWWLLSLFYSE
jgi:hypothetical protein